MDWHRSVDLNEEKNVTAPIVIVAVHALCRCQAAARRTIEYEHNASRIPGCDLSDHSITADVLLRAQLIDKLFCNSSTRSLLEPYQSLGRL